MFDKTTKTEGRRPDFSSREGVQVWRNLDKNSKEYLSVRIPLLNISVNCFQPLEPEAEIEDIKDD